MILQCGDKQLDLTRPVIMGILNTTRDSFSDGGSYFNNGELDIDLALRRAEQMVAEGAAIVDVGGESTRPGADTVSLAEELDRVVPVVEAIRRNVDTIISVDTSSPVVMREAVAVGANLINDVRALQQPQAVETVADLGLPVCLMHMQGDPQTMQRDPHYDDVVADVKTFLQKRAQACINAGIASNAIIVDPGFGFGKTLQHNIALLQRLEELRVLSYPLLVGMSRKSMIDKWLHRPLDQRLPASLALALLAVQRGANIIRVHDVAATHDVAQIQQVIDGLAPPP